MVTIVWTPTGFHGIGLPPTRRKFNSNYYQSEMLEPLSGSESGQAGKASQQFMEENGMARAPHPPYSPDLAPSDIYLFGYMKYGLRRQSFEAADELFSAIE
jgi:hypothetical protein